MTPLSNNTPPPSLKRESSSSPTPQRPTKYFKNEDGDKVAAISELSTKIIEESNSPDPMVIDQEPTISLSVSSLIRSASQPHDLSVSAAEFNKSIKEKADNLLDLIEALISQQIIHTVLAKIPWHELDDTQKNNLFSCFIEIVPQSNYLLRTLSNLIPTTAQDYVPILPLNPSSIVIVGLEHHFPKVYEAYVRLVINYSKDDVFFVPRDALSTPAVGPNHFIQISKELTPAIKRELPLFFKRIPFNFPLPYSIENYFFSCIGRLLGKHNFDLPQLAGATAVEHLTHCHEYDSFEFNRFYKSAGPFLCSKKEKVALQNPRLVLFWQDYLYLNFEGTSEGLLIEKKELLEIEYFASKKEFEYFREYLKKKNEYELLKKTKEFERLKEKPYECFEKEQEYNKQEYNKTDFQSLYPEMEMNLHEFHPTDFFYFFKAIRFNKLPQLDFERLIRLLNLAEHIYCPEMKQLIEQRILAAIPDLEFDLDSLLNLLDYTACSPPVNHVVQQLVWKIDPALIKNVNQLKKIKSSVDFLPENLPDGWSRFIPKLAKNIPSASFSNDNFQNFRYFKNLESVRLNNCTLSQSLFAGFSSLKSVEINGWKGPLEAPSSPLMWEKVKIVQSPSNAPTHFGIELKRFPLDLLKSLKKVKHLEIKSDFNTIFSAIESLKTLEHLSIKFLNVIEFSSFHQCLLQLPNLKTLSLAGDIRLTALNTSILSIENLSLSSSIPYGILGLFPNVKRLNLHTGSFETALLEIKPLHNLEDLTIIEEPPKSSNTPFQMSPNAVIIDPRINNQPGLNRHNALTGLTLDFNNLKNLRKVHFSIHQNVDSFMLASLANSPNLQDITLVSKQNFSKEIYLEIMKKPNLERFSFSRPPPERLFQLQNIYAYALDNSIELNLL